jgi:hypothetical protein
MKKALFTGLAAALLAAAFPVMGQLKTDFADPDAAPLVTHGDFVLRGTALVQYQGHAENVVIPANLGITEIATGAFQYGGGYQEIKTLTIPEGVAKIGERAFLDCYNLEEVRIPATVIKIEPEAFSQNGSLRSITVAARNPSYASVDGVLFNKARTTLILYPRMKPDESYRVPNTVKEIGERAFAYSWLTSVTIPAGLTAIGDYAFSDCLWLRSVTIPAGIAAIGDYAFSSCWKLRSVTLPANLSITPDTFFHDLAAVYDNGGKQAGRYVYILADSAWIRAGDQ